jgi:molybdate/tungstate transport system ATP-binding protein
MMRMEKVSKKWGDFQFKNIDLDVHSNEYFVILGPTGAGKTLLLETIAGFHIPDRGEIFLGEREITALPPEKRGIGLAYQDCLLFPHKTVFENVSYGLRIGSRKGKDIEEKVNEISSRMKISHLLDRYPKNLSGGEAKRVSIARALVIEPELLLLDEPLSALDLPMRNELIDVLKRVHGELGTTFIHVTHNQQESLILGDRIGVLNNGRILQVGDPDEVFRKPRTEFVANFVAVDNLFAGVASVDKDLTRIDVEDISVYSTERREGKVHVSIRPEEILVSKGRMESSARNVFRGKISEISDRGAIVRLLVNASLNFVVYITRQSFHDLELNIGSEVFISFKATAVNVF